MKNIVFLLFLCWLVGCDTVPNEIPMDEKLQLEKLLEALISLSESQPCTNAGDWLITGYGAKACGGPMGHIAYSKKINHDNFIKLVNQFTEAQSAYNAKSGTISNCMIDPIPTRVACENGKAVLKYS